MFIEIKIEQNIINNHWGELSIQANDFALVVDLIVEVDFADDFVTLDEVGVVDDFVIIDEVDKSVAVPKRKVE